MESVTAAEGAVPQTSQISAGDAELVSMDNMSGIEQQEEPGEYAQTNMSTRAAQNVKSTLKDLKDNYNYIERQIE